MKKLNATRRILISICFGIIIVGFILFIGRVAGLLGNKFVPTNIESYFELIGALIIMVPFGIYDSILKNRIKKELVEHLATAQAPVSLVQLKKEANLFEINLKECILGWLKADQLAGTLDEVQKEFIPGEYVKKPPIPNQTGNIPLKFDQRTRLYGIIKVHNEVDLGNAEDILGVKRKEVEGLIYDLVGEGKVEGEFRGGKFVITSNVEDFIQALDAAFSQWGQTTTALDKKT